MNILQETAIALQQEWGLQMPEEISEATILGKLAQRVVILIEKGPDAFYQLMYRLDISEKKLNSVSHQPDAAEQIARLIYDRQLQKIQSRKLYKTDNTETDKDMKW